MFIIFSIVDKKCYSAFVKGLCWQTCFKEAGEAKTPIQEVLTDHESRASPPQYLDRFPIWTLKPVSESAVLPRDFCAFEQLHLLRRCIVEKLLVLSPYFRIWISGDNRKSVVSIL